MKIVVLRLKRIHRPLAIVRNHYSPAFPTISMSPAKPHKNPQEITSNDSQENSQSSSRAVATTLLALSHIPAPTLPITDLQAYVGALPHHSSPTQSPVVTPTPSRLVQSVVSALDQKSQSMASPALQTPPDSSMQSSVGATVGMKRKAKESEEIPNKLPRREGKRSGSQHISSIPEPVRQASTEITGVLGQNPRFGASLSRTMSSSAQSGPSLENTATSHGVSKLNPGAWLKKIRGDSDNLSKSDARPPVRPVPGGTSSQDPHLKESLSLEQPRGSPPPSTVPEVPQQSTSSSSPSLGQLYQKPFAPSLTSPLDDISPFIVRQPVNLEEIATCFDLVKHFGETETVLEKAFSQTVRSHISRMFDEFRQTTSNHRRHLTEGLTTATEGVLALQNRYDTAIGTEDGLRAELATVRQHLVSMGQLYRTQVDANEGLKKAIEDIKQESSALNDSQKVQINTLNGQVSVLSERWATAVKDRERMRKEAAESQSKIKELEMEVEEVKESLSEAAGVVHQAVEEKKQLAEELVEVRREYEAKLEATQELVEVRREYKTKLEAAEDDAEDWAKVARKSDRKAQEAQEACDRYQAYYKAIKKELTRVQRANGLPGTVMEIGDNGRATFTDRTRVSSKSPDLSEGENLGDMAGLKMGSDDPQDEEEEASDAVSSQSAPGSRIEQSGGEPLASIHDGPEAISVKEAEESV
ncbi:hypothetical protein TREMEDRAFT_62884 [Tremella mesenterica DSM 1558]|uniref:uncharacterized protein n=1 Tax=Tremella mesenterica (strain ATCC 24925 / CBS 8224 / DSM 1558 / NBRC 9311 / NRRL Y-6157 / RJB 2259-6 / UBC 559-6) TaxID=578456 RepID=UPI0003F49A96|nr:uncharacterized protein TREMEDRAFT_62884 [Tremella mesenterica DSM 1558]EIW69157.1 hypothetical protein TREMEDRAFT_62884 [Tremella mesenterica DSM 1558]